MGVIMGIFGYSSIVSAITTGDPTSLPNQFILGIGGEFEVNTREMDNETNIKSSRILGRINYSILNDLGVYAKIGLFQTENHLGDSSDWGLGVGFGVRGYFAEFQKGNIRIGGDAQIFSSKVNSSYQQFNEGVTYDESITWTEYQASVVISWRAYAPLHVTTGIQFSKIDLEYDIDKFDWQHQWIIEESRDLHEDQNIALLWGCTYNLVENVQLYAELQALSGLSGSVGFHFYF